MNIPAYPIKFQPILKEKVWGGTKLMKLLNKSSLASNVGESWEISDVENNISVVSNGLLKGQSISEIVRDYKEELLGKHVFKQFGNKFPLLFKFIDAKKTLSVQLHPDDVLAKKRHNSFGKTEMWYIIQADTDSELILGFNQKINKNIFLNAVENNQIEAILHKEKIKQGDAFYISPGLVHAIGAGVLLAEIQQTSDVTYRIYDWNRPDTNGQLRELHNDLAINAIDFDANTNKKFSSEKKNSPLLVESPYFSVSVFNTKDQTYRNISKIDSFVVYMCVSGNTEINCEGASENLITGETVLIPAAVQEIYFKNGNAQLLEIYVPIY
ncbi:type I phosphomannose isomerase catalytic subunit [uncultured Planktosalinus sp.]|uniref:type I phosphomannose isomerase catalytic subunit n=1 Tax=uncultured Planktosalinus sp. TaxID=1810935 RepID=UPI0030D88E1D